MEEATIAGGSPEHFPDCSGENLLPWPELRGKTGAFRCPNDH
jgi:hypothetical protein